jgi:hypothetical protein
MEYKTSRWQADKPDELGRKSLSHTIFPNCQIREFGPAHILGEFKYRLVLGQHMFSIYEYTQEKEGQPVLTREYVMEGQTPGPTPVARPYFLVVAPESNPEPCIVSVHVVLATLHEPPTPPDHWLVYANMALNYEFRYPKGATIRTEGVIGFPTGEKPADMTFDEFLASLEKTYPYDLCVYLEYGVGFIAIQAPENKGGKYTGVCGVTGVGDYDIVEKRENVFIDGTIHIAEGFEIYERNAARTFRAEFYKTQLSDGTRIDYGGYWQDKGGTFGDYILVKEVLLQILASYSTSP